MIQWRYNRLAVSNDGKRLLESSGLSGFNITRRVRVAGDDAEEFKGEYWHVDLPLVLPLSDKMRWEMPDGQVYTGTWVPGAQLPDDGFFAYDRATLQRTGPFDLAVMKPLNPEVRHSTKIGSHRWFEFCKANKIRCNWTPLQVVD